MNTRIALADIQMMKKQRNIFFIYSLIATAGLALNFMTLIYLSESTKTILLPLTIKSPMKFDGSYSKEYLETISVHFLNLRLNITPNSILYQHKKILEFVHPKYYHVVENILSDEYESITKENLSSYFLPSNTSVDADNLSVCVKGQLTQMVDEKVLSNHEVSFKINFINDSGRLWIKSLKKDESHV